MDVDRAWRISGEGITWETRIIDGRGVHGSTQAPLGDNAHNGPNGYEYDEYNDDEFESDGEGEEDEDHGANGGRLQAAISLACGIVPRAYSEPSRVQGAEQRQVGAMRPLPEDDSDDDDDELEIENEDATKTRSGWIPPTVVPTVDAPQKAEAKPEVEAEWKPEQDRQPVREPERNLENSEMMPGPAHRVDRELGRQDAEDRDDDEKSLPLQHEQEDGTKEEEAVEEEDNKEEMEEAEEEDAIEVLAMPSRAAPSGRFVSRASMVDRVRDATAAVGDAPTISPTLQAESGMDSGPVELRGAKHAGQRRRSPPRLPGSRLIRPTVSSLGVAGGGRAKIERQARTIDELKQRLRLARMPASHGHMNPPVLRSGGGLQVGGGLASSCSLGQLGSGPAQHSIDQQRTATSLRETTTLQAKQIESLKKKLRWALHLLRSQEQQVATTTQQPAGSAAATAGECSDPKHESSLLVVTVPSADVPAATGSPALRPTSVSIRTGDASVRHPTSSVLRQAIRAQDEAIKRLQDKVTWESRLRFNEQQHAIHRERCAQAEWDAAQRAMQLELSKVHGQLEAACAEVERLTAANAALHARNVELESWKRRDLLLGGGGQPLSAVTHGGAFDELPPAGGLISRAGLAFDSTSHLHTTTSTPRQQARSKDGTVAWASRLYDELLAGNA